MKNERKIKSVVISAMVLFALLAVFTASASASGGITDLDSPDPSTLLSSSSTSLSSFYNTTINGDYVAAGVGMRGNGSGTITIAGIPGGSTVVKAFLYWAIVDTPPENATFKNGTFAGTAITGTLIGTDDDPCWGSTTTTYAYRADVTSLVSGNGGYALSGFATGPSMPQTGYGEATTPPLCEGASLVVVYSNPSSACRDIVIYDGADTIDGASSVSTVMTGFIASAAPSAKTTYIVADGQDHYSDDTLFNDFILASDTAITSASFEGTDGKLWDTDTYDVSVHVSAGDTSCTVKLQKGSDCLVHTAQVFSVTSTIEVAKDYRYTNVCFEKDNDLDGNFSEDPVNFDAEGNPIDDDGDGLYNEDDVDCPEGTSLGEPLPMDGGNYIVEAVVKNDKVKSYNPGQYYAVSTVNVFSDVDTLTIEEEFCDCNGISTLSPRQGGGCVVIVEIRDDGEAYQILDAKSDEVTVSGDTATAALGAVSADTTILMYVKFGPAQKHGDFTAGTCENTNTASVVTSEGYSASEGASAMLELIEKVYGD